MINGAIRAIPGLSAKIQMICGRFIPVVGVAPQLPEKNTTKHYDYWHNKSNSGTSCGNPNDLREIFLPARIRLKGVGPF